MSPKKKHSEVPSTSAPASGLASSQVTQQLLSTNLQSHLQSPQEKQQPQPVCPWSAYDPLCGQWPSRVPHHRSCLTLSTSATVAGELFLFGGYVFRSDPPSNDLYVISTRDFTTTPLQTSGDVPSPRFGHRAVLTGTTLLIWGGTSDENVQGNDDSFYVLNLVSREWTRIVPNGPGPGGRFHHTMVLVESKLFVFGGRTAKRRLNDIWALDLSCLTSNPFWESYEPAPGNKKPLSRSAHVSVITGDRIIIFGGYDGTDSLNDTWSFNILTRKWTELQCTGSIPSPRAGHAAVLVDDVLYVYGGLSDDKTYLDDLSALNLSTQRWIAFQDIGPSPSGRFGHAMACDGTRIFVFGGFLLPGVQADKTKPFYVLDTQHLVYPEPDSDAVNPSGETAQLVGKSSASPPTRGQPHQSPSSLSDAHAAHHVSPVQKSTPGELDHSTSQQITGQQNPSPNGLPLRPTGVSGRPGRVPEEDNDREDSTGHHAKLVAPDAPSRKELARLPVEDRRLIQLERQLPETLVYQTEQDWRVGQLTDELALKSSLLAQAAEEKMRAGLELRNLQAKLDESLLSRDQAEANAAEEKNRAELELREFQAKHDESLQSRDRALELSEANTAEVKRRAGLEQRELQAKLDGLLLSRGQAEANAAEEKNRAELELRKLQAKLDEALLCRDHALEQAEASAAEEKRRAGLEHRELQGKHDKLQAKHDELQAKHDELQAKHDELQAKHDELQAKHDELQAKHDELQAKLDELMLSCDEHLHTLEQAQSALQKGTSHAANADGTESHACELETKLIEVRAELGGKKSELAAVRLRLTDAEDGWAKSKAEADTLRAGTQAVAGLVNMGADRVMRRLMECVRSVETEMASFRVIEESIEEMECRSEG